MKWCALNLRRRMASPCAMRVIGKPELLLPMGIWAGTQTSSAANSLRLMPMSSATVSITRTTSAQSFQLHQTGRTCHRFRGCPGGQPLGQGVGSRKRLPGFADLTPKENARGVGVDEPCANARRHGSGTDDNHFLHVHLAFHDSVLPHTRRCASDHGAQDHNHPCHRARQRIPVAAHLLKIPSQSSQNTV